MSQIGGSKLVAVAAQLLAGAAPDRPSEARFAAQRESMVETVPSMTAGARMRGIHQIDRDVLDAMHSVPRHSVGAGRG